MASVTFEHVWKRFGETTAVEDFDLEIPDKEFLVLVGPSGCGKSTTLRMLAGLEDITQGSIRIGDRDVTYIPAKDRDIAMVFQSYALYPHMTVYDNMAFGLTLRKIPKDEIKQRVEEAARILGIEGLLKRKPRALSGGQRQRVALGRAIVRKPAVFLFDEPLSNLDAKLRVQTRAEISKLHEGLGTTFIYVTHDQVEAMTMATRIVVMKLGQIQQVGTPGQLYDHPANMFVGGFIGSPAMNFFDGTIKRDDGNFYLDLVGDFRLPVPEDRKHDIEDHLGKEIIAGVRPENIHAAEFAPPGIQSAEVEADVTVTELLGNETIAYVHRGKGEFLARLDPRVNIRPGQKMMLAIDIDRMHIFDPETEEALGSVKPTTAAV